MKTFLLCISGYMALMYFGTLWIQAPVCEPLGNKIARAERILATEFRMIATGEIK